MPAQQVLLPLSHRPRPSVSFLYVTIPIEMTAIKSWDT